MRRAAALRRVAKTGKFLVPVVIAFFVGRVIQSNWAQIRAAEWDVQPLYLVGSVVLCSSWFWCRPLGWSLLVNGFGQPVPFTAVYRVVRRAELSRFIPGGVWQFASRVYLVKKWNVSASSALSATVIDLVLTTLAALVPALWILTTAFPELGHIQRVTLIGFAVLSIAVLHPRIFNSWASFVFRRLGQRYVHLEIHWRTLLGIWAMYVGSWILMCAGVALFIRGVIEVEPGGMTFIGSSYAVAWLAGNFAMISPAGMGIREGVLGLLLAEWMPDGPAFALAIGIRLWLLLMEVGWVSVGEFLPRPEPAPGISPGQ